MNLILFLSIPAALMVVFGLPSIAIGMFFYFALYISFHMKNIFKSFSIQKSYFQFLIICSAYILLNIIPPYDIGSFFKSTFSFLLLTLFFIGATYFFSNLAKDLDICEKKIIQNAYKLILFIGICSIIGLIPTFVTLYNPKLVFPFLEPSHFTIAFSLISTTMICISESRYRPYILLTTLFFSIAFPSTLCLAVFCMQILLLISSAKMFWRVFLLFILIAPFVFIFFDLDYYLLRITGGAEDTINLTNLIYLQGWESIISSFKDSFGFGLGFQMMGEEYSGPIAELLCEVHYMCANNQDGSFFLSKITTEFGIIGLFISIFFLYMSFRSMILLRHHISTSEKAQKMFSTSEVFGLSSLFVFSAELLLRGYGYFSPTFLIALYYVYLPLKYKITSLKVS